MDGFFLLWAIGAALLGAIFASFINALSFRYHTGRGMGGRSRCMRCGHALSSLDLVPVFSYASLGGRCRYCGVRVSMQYPLIEIAGAALALGAFLLAPEPIGFAYTFALGMILLFIAVYDVQHTALPGMALALLALLALGSLIASCDTGCHLAAPSFWGFAAGPILALPLLSLSAISGGRWMGWGDGLLEISFGWLLGITQGFTALCIAFWSGALIGIALLLWSRLWRARGKPLTMTSEIPFAPFLIAGAVVAYAFHVDFFSTLLLF